MRKQVLHPRTAVINQKQKNQSKKSRYEALKWLSEKFPAAFDNTQQIMPLTVGIMAEILKYSDEAAMAGISKSKLREAVVVFTRRLDYLACLKAREMRVNLQGQPIVMVTEEEAESASLKIKKRIEKAVKNIRTTAALASSSKSVPTTKKSFPPLPSLDLNYRDEAHLTSSASTRPTATPTITVKQKISRVYDPDAVARLKEKLGLGLAQKEELPR